MAKAKTVEKQSPKTSAVDKVLKQLLSDIQSSKIVPGQRLITSELAKDLNTSLAPVREAFHLLAGEGLLELLPNRGARVRALSTENLLEGEQVLQVVGALAIRLASKKTMTTELKAEFVTVMNRIYTAGENRDAIKFFRAISNSHRLMNQFAGNSYLDPVMNRLHLEYFNIQLSGILPGNWERYLNNYRELGDLVAAQNFGKLETAWNKHSKWVMSLLEEKIRRES